MANPHPTLTFTVNLTLSTQEAIGPITNSHDEAVLHPDQYQIDPDVGRLATAQRVNDLVTWLPGLFAGNNINLKHGDSFTTYGSQAIYLRDMYGIGYAPADRAVLTVS